MTDLNWLATEARHLHNVFLSSFYLLVTIMLLVGLLLEYLKIPLGQMPAPLILVGRALVAALLLTSIPEVMNFLGTVTDEICRELGSLNEIKLMLSRLGDKMGELTWSWISVKDSVLLLISFLSFFVLYVTVYIMNAYFIFTWMLLYIFSPIMCAFFVMPQTEGATKKLFKSMLEVCLWKITWGVMAALLWSFALSDINQSRYDVDFLTAIILNLMLAFSVLLTPKLVGSIMNGGVSQMASGFGNILMGAAALTPTGLLMKSKMLAVGAASRLRNNRDEHKQSPNVQQARQSLARKFYRK